LAVGVSGEALGAASDEHIVPLKSLSLVYR
jgi:hypothetical protein